MLFFLTQGTKYSVQFLLQTGRLIGSAETELTSARIEPVGPTLCKVWANECQDETLESEKSSTASQFLYLWIPLPGISISFIT